jgi:hypothetical protein
MVPLWGQGAPPLQDYRRSALGAPCPHRLLKEQFHQPGVELFARLVAQVGSHLRFRPAPPIGTVFEQRVPRVHHRGHPRQERNTLPAQAIGIARPVPVLVVVARDGSDVRHGGAERHQAAPQWGVLAHHGPLSVGQRARLVHNRIGDAD